MKKVSFWHAIEWICDDCGRNNFSSMVKPELSEEEEKEIKEGLGIESWKGDEDGELCMAPEQVSCKFCNAEFELAEDLDQ